MALRTPFDPDEPSREPESGRDEEREPENEGEESLAEAGEGGEWDENPEEETEDLPQPDDPDGVSKGMATVALDQRMFEAGAARATGGKSRAGTADWRAMEDAEIMIRVREGDDSGFAFLIEKYRKPMVSFMFRMVHNQAIAEELAQEVFLRVYRSRQTYRAEAKFSTWVYRIATNLGVNHARDTKHERMAQNVYLDQPDPETGTTPEVADARPGAEEELVREERMRAIRKHVMALPERQRNAVLMHKYQGLDYKEIGAVLHLSESATKSLLFRAYQTLREKLKGFVDEGAEKNERPASGRRN
jgi:RNA polymerase sigma-70 factor, ECF subfamily